MAIGKTPIKILTRSARLRANRERLARESQLLWSWGEIAAALRVSEDTVRDWRSKYGLPVYRSGPGRTCMVYALRDEVTKWMLEHGDRYTMKVGHLQPTNPGEQFARAVQLVVADLDKIRAAKTPNPSAALSAVSVAASRLTAALAAYYGVNNGA